MKERNKEKDKERKKERKEEKKKGRNNGTTVSKFPFKTVEHMRVEKTRFTYDQNIGTLFG